MKIYYRISDGEDKGKVKFPHATKQHCLENFLQVFPNHEIVVYADNVRDETYEWLLGMQAGYQWNLKRTDGGSSAAGFRICLEDAIRLPDDESVLLVEEDYLHLPNAYNVILEGLEKVDYVTLYLHGDRFIPASMGGNPMVDETGAFVSRVFKTKSAFWCQIDSTTMTFATSVKTLKEDYNIWLKHSMNRIPHDYDAFRELGEKNLRTIACTIPGMSTHCEVAYASPLIDWEHI